MVLIEGVKWAALTMLLNLVLTTGETSGNHGEGVTCYNVANLPVVSDFGADCGTLDPHEAKEAVVLGGSFCRSHGTVKSDWICKDGDVQTNITCLNYRACNNGRFMDSKGVCSMPRSSCYHTVFDVVPKGVKVEFNCSLDVLKRAAPRFCSIGVHIDECDPSPKTAEVKFIISDDGTRYYVNDYHIENAQVGRRESSYWTDARLPEYPDHYGDKSYCEFLEPNKQNCFSSVAIPGKSYRVFKQKSLRTYAHLPGCITEVRGYGSETVIYYDYLGKQMKTTCPDCKVTCNKDFILLTIPEPGSKIIRICGKSGCITDVSAGNFYKRDRSFHQKTSDDIINIWVSDSFGQYKYDLEVACPLVDICDAIDCWFCKINLVNISCYTRNQIVVILLITMVVLNIMGGTLMVLCPIIKMILFVIHLILKIIAKIITTLLEMSRGGAGAIRRFAEDHKPCEETKSITGQWSNPGFPTELPLIAKTASTRRFNPFSIQTSFFSIILLTSFQQCHTMGHISCSISTAENYPAESCVKVGDQYICRRSSLISMALAPTGDTSCLHYIDPKGKIIGEIQITTLTSKFICSKRIEYTTRNVDYKTDVQFFCPFANGCNEEWCDSVNGRTKIPGWTAILNAPTKVYCIMGNACWANGCFFCTSSCRVIRHYPVLIDRKVHTVFTCSSWKPMAKVRIFVNMGSINSSKTYSITHGQEIAVSDETTVKIEFNLQTKLPSLYKSMVTDGDKVALVDLSSANQPLAGTISGLQCPRSTTGSDLSQCTMADSTCNCAPSGGSVTCNCLNVNLTKLYFSDNSLPVHVGDDFLETKDGEVYLNTRSYGSAMMLIKSKQSITTEMQDPKKCDIDVKIVDGCYSCLQGATVEYICNCLVKQSIILTCDDDIFIQMTCDNTGLSKKTIIHTASPLLKLHCMTQCSEEPIQITGILKSIGLITLNNASHILISVKSQGSELHSWFDVIIHKFGWLDIGYYGAILMVTLILSLVVGWCVFTKVISPIIIGNGSLKSKIW